MQRTWRKTTSNLGALLVSVRSKLLGADVAAEPADSAAPSAAEGAAEGAESERAAAAAVAAAAAPAAPAGGADESAVSSDAVDAFVAALRAVLELSDALHMEAARRLQALETQTPFEEPSEPLVQRVPDPVQDQAEAEAQAPAAAQAAAAAADGTNTAALAPAAEPGEIGQVATSEQTTTPASTSA